VKKTIPTLLLLLTALLAAPTPAAAAEPAGLATTTTYKEVKALIDDTVAAHPGIARRFSIGRNL
jgi:hypothetical protein